eukprot:CCRYP_006146-RA/>CCRYP_006146-RA protein AED:0.18 eAED:0.18 QI:127/1/1/1/0.66/0.75/4/282/1677
MWGFSFDDLARRAQEEAAKLAEQAQHTAASIQSPGFLNFDSMNPDLAQQQQEHAAATDGSSTSKPHFGTPAASHSHVNAPLSNADSNTAPPTAQPFAVKTDEFTGNVNHFTSLVSDVASPRAASTVDAAVDPSSTSNINFDGDGKHVGSTEKKKKPTVTKLTATQESDDFFDSWGEDGNDSSHPADTTNSISKNAESTGEGSQSMEQEIKALHDVPTIVSNAEVSSEDHVTHQQENVHVSWEKSRQESPTVSNKEIEHTIRDNIENDSNSPAEDPWGENDLDLEDENDRSEVEKAIAEDAPASHAEMESNVTMKKDTFGTEETETLVTEEADPWGKDDVELADLKDVQMDDATLEEETPITYGNVPPSETTETAATDEEETLHYEFEPPATEDFGSMRENDVEIVHARDSEFGEKVGGEEQQKASVDYVLPAEEQEISAQNNEETFNEESGAPVTEELDGWDGKDLDIVDASDISTVNVEAEPQRSTEEVVSTSGNEMDEPSNEEFSNDEEIETTAKGADAWTCDNFDTAESRSGDGQDTYLKLESSSAEAAEAGDEIASINAEIRPSEELKEQLFPADYETKRDQEVSDNNNEVEKEACGPSTHDDHKFAAVESNDVIDHSNFPATNSNNDTFAENVGDELTTKKHFINNASELEDFALEERGATQTKSHDDSSDIHGNSELVDESAVTMASIQVDEDLEVEDQLAGEEILTDHQSSGGEVQTTENPIQCHATLDKSNETQRDDLNISPVDEVLEIQNQEMDGDPVEIAPNPPVIHVASEEEDREPKFDKLSTAESTIDHESTSQNALPNSNLSAHSTLFDGASNITAATQTLQSVFESHASNLFDVSKSANMFAWNFQNATTSNGGDSQGSEKSPPNAPDGHDSAKETLFQTNEMRTHRPVVEDSTDSSVMDDLYNDDALDDMYDDDDDDDDEEEANGAQSKNDDPGSLDDAKKMIGEGEVRSAPEAVPQHVVEKFMKQLERMTESHQLEMEELQRSHKMEIDQLQNELEMERAEKKKAKAREAVAAQDKHLSQMRELEKSYNKILKEKEDELEQVMQRNEGITLKMDSMKREVDGLLRLVDERDDEICRLKQGHGNTMLQVEGNMKVSQDELLRKDAEIRDLKSTLSSLQSEFDSTTDAFNTLKSRAKAVATELKDRRVEVRTLSSQNEELTAANTSLETQLANLKALNDQQQLTIAYKDKDIEALNEKVKELNKQIEAKDGLLQDRSSVGEKAISSYKRKAQEALAAANARLAAANQAREEAESDAKAARTASDDAVERARVSDAKRVEAERSAAEASKLLEAERSVNLQVVSELKRTVDEMKKTIQGMRDQSIEAESTKESLLLDIERVKADLTEQNELNSELREKLFEQKDLCNALQKEVLDLQDEVQRSSAAAFKRQKDETIIAEKQGDSTSVNNVMSSIRAADMNDRAESDGTIIMLQQELQGANDAISELKLALRMALLEKTEPCAANAHPDKRSLGDQDRHFDDSAHGNDNTPLFFAIEKQNELNTARDEINRLANLLGDAESEKQEAFDAMEEMRQKMEEANARLLRYEKLGMTSTRPPHSSAGYSSLRGAGRSTMFADGHTGERMVSRENDSAVNLEYLKNVMLSYLKAKTLADRRKLVPVIATVLCLTPEEQSQAVLSVEESAGLVGVASSFWENLESKAHNLM